MPYILDANVFIEAKNRYYGLDFCPAFWDWLIAKNAEGKVFSIESVLGELEAVADELTEWALARGNAFFLRPDPGIGDALRRVSEWVTGERYEPSAVSTFLTAADYYLVVSALAHGHVVVTHERPSASTKKVKIPEACVGLGIRVMTPFDMLRRERARFVLGAAP